MSSNTFDVALLDIEGTTTSIRFVYDTLFPYAREAMEAYITENQDNPSTRTHVEQVARDAQAIPGCPEVDPANPETVLASLLWQMDHDHKTTGLKGLQGDIWRAGYEDGTLKGHVYPEVTQALRALHARDVPIYIYSSGSVAAQRLLFGHSIDGDLTEILSGYFDTTTGPKKVKESYLKIADHIGHEPGRVLFATDNLDEARAAHAAGMQVRLMRRPGNPDVAAHDFVEEETFAFLNA